MFALGCFAPNDAVCAETANSALNITSKAAILMDMETQTILLSKNEEEPRQIASMVKLMTILLTLEEIDNGHLTLDKMVTASEEAQGMGGSQVFVDAFSEYSISDMLKSVIVASANDAAVVLAEAISGSETAFVDKMNARAKELGLVNTRYSNATGLNAPDQYSTAKDVALLLCKVAKYETFSNFSSIWMEDFVHPSGRKTELVNTNRLSKYFAGSTGGKTGFTDEALFCLSESAKRGNMQLIGVVLGAKDSKTRFNECASILNYGFASFEKTDVLSCTEKFASLPVVKSETQTVDVFAKESFSSIAKKGEKSKFEVVTEMKDKIVAPSRTGFVVGKAMIVKDGQIVKEIELVINEDIDSITLIGASKKIVKAWK